MTELLVDLTVAETPPSLNTYAGAHWAKFAGIKRRWQSMLAQELQYVAPGKAAGVHAIASLRFPVRRRRDEGNFRAMLEKALGDALVAEGWIEDDTPESFTFGELVFEDEVGEPQTTVQMFWTRKEATDDKDN